MKVHWDNTIAIEEMTSWLVVVGFIHWFSYKLLLQGLAADKSDEWYAKKGKTKESA